MSPHDDALLPLGTVVIHEQHGVTGTVTGHGDGTLLVAWFNSFVEDEVLPADVTRKPNPTPAELAWRGGMGIVQGDLSVAVEPSTSSDQAREGGDG